MFHFFILNSTGSGCVNDYTVTCTWRATDLYGNSATEVITVQGTATRKRARKTERTRLV